MRVLVKENSKLMSAPSDILPISQSTTLGDLFLDLLEKNASDNLRQCIQEVRVCMTSPDYAKLFSVLLITALGYYTQIEEGQVDNAITFMIKRNELIIDSMANISEEEKNSRKKMIESFLLTCKQSLKDQLSQHNILIYN